MLFDNVWGEKKRKNTVAHLEEIHFNQKIFINNKEITNTNNCLKQFFGLKQKI